MRCWVQWTMGHAPSPRHVEQCHVPGIKKPFLDIGHEPCNAILQSQTQWMVLDMADPAIDLDTLPDYRIPSTSEINKLAGSNGYTAVSTFSGCGGSSLGLKWAGFDVPWASEFIDAAADTYEANSPGTIVDRRDIREVTGAEILEAVGKPIDVLEGSPPCAAFSTAGRRDEGWGEERKYSETVQRVDDLFVEYVRLIDEIRPRCFVAENVAGLRIGRAKGFLKEIVNDMRDIGYRVAVWDLDAQWLGVPQRRRRLIFVGSDPNTETAPKPPDPHDVRIPLAAAIGPLAAKSGPLETDPETGFPISMEPYATGREWRLLRQGTSSDRYFNLVRGADHEPSPTVTQTGGNVGAAAVAHPTECRKFTLAELRRICGFPDDFVLTGSYGQRWERLGRSVVPPMYLEVGRQIADYLRSEDT